MNDYIFTAESATEGHPDKMADQISDAILDYILERDKDAKVSCETLLSNGFCVITGDLNTKIYAPMQDIVRGVVREIGYTDASYGFDYRTAAVLNGLGESIDNGRVIPNSQAVVFGYATNESENLMPLSITLAHKLTYELSKARKSGLLPFLRPDGKAQVALKYVDNRPHSIDSITLSTQHSQDIEYSKLKEAVMEDVIKRVIPKNLITTHTKFYINPKGNFIIGGPQGNAGLSGRKIVSDSYGGVAPNGGGAFSGKDPSKIDRSGAYMARYIAKNLVGAGVCEKVTIQLAYTIGISNPISMMIDTHNSSKIETKKLYNLVKSIFKLTPEDIINGLNLINPIYKKCSNYGHFGRNEFSWEQLDMVEAIQNY